MMGWGGGSHYILQGPGVPEGPRGFVFVYLVCIVICRLYKLTLSSHSLVTLELNVSLSDLVQRILAGPHLLESLKKKLLGSETAVGGSDRNRTI